MLKANNPWRLSDFPTRAPGLDWATYFEAATLSDQPMIMVWQPSGVAGLAALAGSEPLDLWKDYLTFRTIDRDSRPCYSRRPSRTSSSSSTARR